MEQDQEPTIASESLVKEVSSDVSTVPPTTTPTTTPSKPAKNEGTIFNGVHFCLCDDVGDTDEIKKILVDGGGKLVNYLSDVVTHVIAENPDHPDVTEALEIYEKPVVTTKWVRMSLESGKLLPVGAFNPSNTQLFSSVTVCVSSLERVDVESIWAMVTYHGGKCKLQLDKSCTHLITSKPEGIKYDKAKERIKVVTPDWVIDCIKKKEKFDEELYQPKLLVTYCTRPRPQAVQPEPFRPRMPASSPASVRNVNSQVPGTRQVRPFNQPPVRVASIPKSVQKTPTQQQANQLTLTPTQQFNPDQNQQNWSNQQGSQQQQFLNRPPSYMDMNRMRFEGGQQQMQMSPRNQVFLSLQQQPQVRQQQPQVRQQLNFVQVRHVQPQQQFTQQQMQPQNQQPSQQKPPNVILQQRIQPPVHTLSLNQQQQQQQNIPQQQQQQNIPQQQQQSIPQQNLIIQANQHPNQMQFQQQQQLQQQSLHQQPQQMVPIQRHPDMGQQVYRQNIVPRTGYVNQPRVPRVPQIRMSQQHLGPSQPIRGPMPCGPQQMMPQYGQMDGQRMNMRQPMDMNQNPQMLRHPGQQGMQIRQQQSWNDMSPQVIPRGQGMPMAGQNFPPQQNMHPQNHMNNQNMHPQNMNNQNMNPQNMNNQNMSQPMMWSNQPVGVQPQTGPPPLPVTPNEVQSGQRGPARSPRSGEKRNSSSNLSSPKSGTLSSVSSAVSSMSNNPTGNNSTLSSAASSSGALSSGASSFVNSAALVTSKTKTALANLLNTRLQNTSCNPSSAITSSSRSYHDHTSSAITSSSSRSYHDHTSSAVTYSTITYSGSTGTSSSSSSCTSTPTSLTAPVSSLPHSHHSHPGDGFSTPSISCCPLSPNSNTNSNRLVCVGSPGVILPTGEILHRGLLETQPVKERYVGHDSSVTIPGDICLVGCIFFISGYETGPFVLNAKQRDLMESRIRRSGGEVESFYSTEKITHVMCDTQDAPCVEQAIRDGKRLVTVYWLDAVIKGEKKMRVPWRVIHLPRSPRFLPAKEIIASTGFSIIERQLIREVCIQIGALYTPHFCPKNTVLVCKKLEGEKYDRGVEWCIPIVNVQWLNDVALGVNDAMKKPFGCNPKHKRFDLKDPFDLVDTPSIRNIMVGWIQPIRVSEEVVNKVIEEKKKIRVSEEVVNKVIEEKKMEMNSQNGSASESEVKAKDDDDVFAKPPAKKVRLNENVAPDGNSNKREEGTSNKREEGTSNKREEGTSNKKEEGILPPPPPLTLAPFATVPFKVMITGVNRTEKGRLEAIVKRLGAKCTTKFLECTHLVAEGAIRTVKFLCALNHATHIVSKSWLVQSEASNNFVSESGHEISEMKSSLSKRKERGEKFLLEKKVIYITPGCIPSPIVLNELIQNAGGVPVTSRGPTRNQMEKMKEHGLQFLILTNKETDIHLIDQYLDRKVPCLSPEWVLSSIMNQDLCPYSDFQITATTQ